MSTRAAPCPRSGFDARPFRLTLLPLVALAALGCKSAAKQSFVDSEQRRFSAQCDAKGDCQLETEGAPTATNASPTRGFTLWRAGRVVGICEPASAGAPPTVADCRPLVCQADADCPPAQGLPHGVCINQLCIEPSHAVNVDDAVQLCLAGTGVGPRRPAQVERIALGLNCGTPCQIPKPCRQP